MNLQDIIIGTIGVGVIGAMLWVHHKFERRRVRGRLISRPDNRDAWGNTGADPEMVDSLLMIIVEEFEFDHEERYRLGPNDTLMTAYRIEYPRTPMADSLELENIAKRLKNEHGVLWNDGDPTLLGLVRRIEQQRGNVN